MELNVIKNKEDLMAFGRDMRRSSKRAPTTRAIKLGSLPILYTLVLSQDEKEMKLSMCSHSRDFMSKDKVKASKVPDGMALLFLEAILGKLWTESLTKNEKDDVRFFIKSIA